MHKSETIDTILTSEEGKKLLEFVSPIYDESYVGLSIFQAIGLALDKAAEATDGYELQMRPETATWGLALWEKEYGLISASSASYASRRAAILTKIRSRGPMNPARIKSIVETVTGFDARVENHIAKNTFSVYVSAEKGDFDETVLRAALDKAKPAHLIYTLDYEQSIAAGLAVGGSAAIAKIQTIKQVR